MEIQDDVESIVSLLKRMANMFRVISKKDKSAEVEIYKQRILHLEDKIIDIIDKHPRQESTLFIEILNILKTIVSDDGLEITIIGYIVEGWTQ
jgi:hypothetical protein